MNRSGLPRCFLLCPKVGTEPTVSQGWPVTDSVSRLARNRLSPEVGSEPARPEVGTEPALSERRVMCAGTRLCRSTSCVVPTLAGCQPSTDNGRLLATFSCIAYPGLSRLQEGDVRGCGAMWGGADAVTATPGPVLCCLQLLFCVLVLLCFRAELDSLPSASFAPWPAKPYFQCTAKILRNFGCFARVPGLCSQQRQIASQSRAAMTITVFSEIYFVERWQHKDSNHCMLLQIVSFAHPVFCFGRLT